MKSGRIYPWAKIRRAIGRSNSWARLAHGRFSADCIMNTAGCSIQQASQVDVAVEGLVHSEHEPGYIAPIRSIR